MLSLWIIGCVREVSLVSFVDVILGDSHRQVGLIY